MEPEVQLVGDVTEIAAAAGGAAVVHLERRDDASVVDLDGLRVLSADVEHGARAGEDAVGAAAVAEDLASHRLRREGERLTSVAGADGGELLDRLPGCALHGAGEGGTRGVARGASRENPVERAPHQRRDVARLAAGLDVDDRAIEQRGDRLERDLARARERLGLRHVGGAGEVPEEVASARCALEKHRGRGALHAVEHVDDARARARCDGSGAVGCVPGREGSSCGGPRARRGTARGETRPRRAGIRPFASPRSLSNACPRNVKRAEVSVSSRATAHAVS